MRQEFPAKVKVAAFERADGRCQSCTALLYVGKYTYDHITPDWMGGQPTLENCQVICSACDRTKTTRDQHNIAKSKRVIRRHAGVKKPRTIRAWRKFSGEAVYAKAAR